MKPAIDKTRPQTKRVVHEAEAGVSGALAGAAMGAIAGPPGAIAGAVLGGVAGVLAGVALENQAEDSALREAELDDTIGVAGGNIGAPGLDHPPESRGTFSGAASGAASVSAAPAEGPIQSVD